MIIMITCPTCKKGFSEVEWNKNTKEIVNNLNNDNKPIILIQNRYEDCLYRCPNINCQDEVVTGKHNELQIQD